MAINAINTVADSSSNPILSLPQSSSRFPNLSNENDIYRIEESEIYDNSKGDIVEWYNNNNSSFLFAIPVALIVIAVLK